MTAKRFGAPLVFHVFSVSTRSRIALPGLLNSLRYRWTSVSAMVLPPGSLIQAALKRPLSKMPCSSVFIPGWSYCSNAAPREAA
jgi:hypothetical protein